MSVFLVSMVLLFSMIYLIMESSMFCFMLLLVLSILNCWLSFYSPTFHSWWVLMFLLVFVMGMLMIFSFMMSFSQEVPKNSKVILFKHWILMALAIWMGTSIVCVDYMWNVDFSIKNTISLVDSSGYLKVTSFLLFLLLWAVVLMIRSTHSLGGGVRKTY